MMRKPRVLIIDNSIAVTGALKSITSSSYDLKEYFDFQFVIPKNSKGRFWIEEFGFTDIHELPMKEIRKDISALLFYFPFLLINSFRLLRIVRKQSISVIHVNDLYNLLPCILQMFGTKTPYICHIRFLPNRFPALLLSSWLRLHTYYGSKLIAVSQSVLDMMPPHPKLILIYGELPIEELYPKRIENSQLKQSYTFLYLSNFIVGKGQNYALDAFSKVHAEIPNWKLRFVGGDMGLKKNKDFRDSLEIKAKALNIFDKIEWNGFTNDVELEYKQADVVINFSESESFSKTCTEALYYGRPLIATACGGPAEIIDHGVTGILLPNRDIDAMASAMLELALEKKKRVALGLAARSAVRDKFSVEKTSFRLKEIYDVLIKPER